MLSKTCCFIMIINYFNQIFMLIIFNALRLCRLLNLKNYEKRQLWAMDPKGVSVITSNYFSITLKIKTWMILWPWLFIFYNIELAIIRHWWIVCPLLKMLKDYLFVYNYRKQMHGSTSMDYQWEDHPIHCFREQWMQCRISLVALGWVISKKCIYTNKYMNCKLIT